jgi:hypothetical protein
VGGLLSIELIESTRRTADGRNDSDESLREIPLQLDGNGSVTRTGDTGVSWSWAANTDRHGHADEPAGHTDRHGHTDEPAGHTDRHGHTDEPAGHTDRHGHTDEPADASTDLRRYVGRDQDRHDRKGPEPDQQPEG